MPFSRGSCGAHLGYNEGRSVCECVCGQTYLAQDLPSRFANMHTPSIAISTMLAISTMFYVVCITAALYPLNSDSQHFPLPAVPGNHHSGLSSYESYYFIFLIEVESSTSGLSVSSLFHLVSCPPCCLKWWDLLL